MNKIILTIGMVSSLLISPAEKDRDKYLISEALNNIQDMKEWMQQDIDRDNVITDLVEFYVENLNEVEDMLIKLSNTN